MEGEAYKHLTMASSTNKRLGLDSDDDELDASAIYKSQKNFARYLIIKDKPILFRHLSLKNKFKQQLEQQISEKTKKTKHY